MKSPASARSNHRIVFVTGKGGVGKSSVAAATALQFARRGETVLLLEFGSRSFYGPFLGLPVHNDPVQWRPKIEVARWDVEEALREYIAHYLVFKSAANKILNNTVMKALIGAAPSMSEIAILGKLTAPMRHHWYRRDVDVVVIDAYSTGQFMAMLRAPRGLAATAPAGPIHHHTQAMVEVLADARVCEYRLVTLAEEMPVSEACEMIADIYSETGLRPRVYCNRMLSIPPLPNDATADATTDAAASGAFLEQMRHIDARQTSSLERLTQAGAAMVHTLPLTPTLEINAMLERLADALEIAAMPLGDTQ